MVCYPYARDRFKVAIPNGIKRYWDVVPPAQEVRVDTTREMRVQTSMITLPYETKKKPRNQAKRYRLNRTRRFVEQNRAAR